MLRAPVAGWLCALDEVADPVFAGRLMGEGFAIDPVEGELRAPADATVTHVADSAHALTLRLGSGAELLLHVGLETVALRGAGFRVAVTEGQVVAAGDLLIAFDLDVVGRAARDLVTPVVAPDASALVRIDRPGRLVAAGEPVAWLTAADAIGTDPHLGTVEERRITVAAPQGLHARPAARIVALLKPFAAEVEIVRGERRANARSPVSLLAVGAGVGDELQVLARGRDAAMALDALERFAGERFGDPAVGVEPAPAPAPPIGDGGVCASPGLAIGRTLRLRPDPVEVAEQGIGVAEEAAALDDALRIVSVALAGVGGGIADAQRAMLDDPVLRDAAQDGIAKGRSAGAAWRAAIDAAAAALHATGDPRVGERVADLRDLERQVLLELAGETFSAPVMASETILIAEDLLPSQFLSLDRQALAGICTAAGGPTAHVAILAAAAGVPMIVAAGADVMDVADGSLAILDADAGRLVVDPDPVDLADAQNRLVIRRDARARDLSASVTPALTADAVRIGVFANVGSVADAEAAVNAGAEGCGLLRTEFLFLDRETAPDEAEQRALYAQVAEALGDRPLIVRTLDIGGDKPVAYLPAAPEENPALGQRGVRLSLARPDLLDTQLRAIVAAVPGDRCRIMLPMVVDEAELLAVRSRLQAAMAEVGRTDPVELGVMIETPAAALLADQLARHADFLSVGTNDLTQYALAADRGNAAVSSMVDALHPAVLRLIRMAADGAARHGRWLGVCGSLASDPRAAGLLVGLGVTELSAVPAAVPAVKAAVRRTSLIDARAMAERALAARSADEVRSLVEEMPA